MSDQDKKKGKKKARKFSEHFKKSVVASIDSGDYTASEVRRIHNLSDLNTIYTWIVKYSVSPEKHLGKKISPSERRQAALRLHHNEATVMELSIEYKVSQATIYDWLRKLKEEEGDSPSAPTSDPAQRADLGELEQLRLKVAALETMIDIAEEELKIDIRKKSGAKQ